MIDDRELDAFQTALTELLIARRSVDEMIQALATEPAFAPHRAWVTSFDRDALDVSSMLAARWASKT